MRVTPIPLHYYLPLPRNDLLRLNKFKKKKLKRLQPHFAFRCSEAYLDAVLKSPAAVVTNPICFYAFLNGLKYKSWGTPGEDTISSEVPNFIIKKNICTSGKGVYSSSFASSQEDHFDVVCCTTSLSACAGKERKRKEKEMSKTDVKKSREASGILTLQVNLRERWNFLNLMQNKLFSWKIRFSAIKGKCSQKSKYFRRSRSEDCYVEADLKILSRTRRSRKLPGTVPDFLGKQLIGISSSVVSRVSRSCR